MMVGYKLTGGTPALILYQLAIHTVHVEIGEIIISMIFVGSKMGTWINKNDIMHANT